MKIYVAGRMRGVVRYNVEAFQNAAQSLRAQGHLVWSPVEYSMERGWNPDAGSDFGPLSPRDEMEWNTDRILEADAVAVLPDWEQSQGASLEVALARF